MKALVQCVKQARVVVEDEIISSIGKGICVFIGISRDDTDTDVDFLVRKVLNTRLFEDDNGKRWNVSVKDKGYEILCISQFTLYHELKGNKLDFHKSMSGEAAKLMYTKFLNKLKSQYEEKKVKDGVFGALMEVDLTNYGPVTIMLDSNKSSS